MRSWDEYKQTMTVADHPCLAATANDVARLQFFAEQGSDLNVKDARGFSPLMLAAYHGHLEATSFLLAQGVDVDSPDAAGNTVLMGTAFKGHAALARQLLAAGANVAARNHAGMTAHDVATHFGRTEILAILAANSAAKRPLEGQG